MKALNSTQATFELLVATLFWGFGYIATIWALELLSPLGMSFYRFFFAAILGLLLVKTFRVPWSEYLRLFRLSFWPGLFLAVLMISQTWGLKYTSAINSSFITSMYVVFTPLIEWVVLRQKTHWSFLVFLAASLFGVILILGGPLQFSAESWIGDLMTLVCALFSSFHIITVGRVWSQIRRPFLFHSMQSLWAALCLLPFFAFELFHQTTPHVFGFQPTEHWTAWVGITSLVLGSTVLAFFLQIRAQSILSPSLTSLVCLVESPLALVFAVILLKESIGLMAGVGAGLIFFSALGASLAESWMKKNQTYL